MEDAANSAENKSRTRGIVRHRFKPGQSGNPSGRPKKKPLTELYEEILNDSKKIGEVRRAIIAVLVKAQPGMVPLLKEMADRTEGPVKQQISLDAKITYETLIAAAANLEADEPGDS